MKKYIVFLYIVVTILFTSCSGENHSKSNGEFSIQTWNGYMQEYVIPNMLNNDKTFDYYEIENDEILTTTINIDLINVWHYFNLDDPSYTNSIYEIKKDYNLVNEALNINITFEAMIVYNYDTLTNVSEKIIYKKNYGLIEVSKNFCKINTESKNCTSYLYINN